MAWTVLIAAFMSDGVNVVTLFGNLGADPELKQTSKGPVLKLRLATGQEWVDKETKEKKGKTEWHRVALFGSRAEGLSKILGKGMRIFVHGRLSTSSWEKDGIKQYKTEVIAHDIQLGTSRANGGFVPPQTIANALAADAPF